MTADERAALAASLSGANVRDLLAMVLVELVEVRTLLEPPAPGAEPDCPHPEDRRAPGGMGTGIRFHCLECGYESRTA